MGYEQVLTEQRGRVLILTLNRPEKLNAWNDTLMHELRDAVEKANADPGVGAIVFTGAGRAFCAGADIGGWQKQLAGQAPARGSATAGEDNWVNFVRRMPKPMIAAVNGPSVGVGVTFILPMDVRIASENGRFGFFFVKMALVPELASSYYLTQLVGLGRAQEWCLTARLVEPAEAKEAGLITEVTSQEALLDGACAIGEQIASFAPSAIARVKRAFQLNATDSDIASVMLRENFMNATARSEPDHREAVAAFMEKRAPNWVR